MSKDVSFIRNKSGLERSSTTLFDSSRPLYRRAQTATATKKIKKYPEPAEFLAERRKSLFRTSSIARFVQSSTGSKQFQDEVDDNIEVVQTLIKSTERNPQNVFSTSGLKRFRLLHEIINLNRTPIDFHTLAKLQKRENLIIQTNALKDERYIYLYDSLQQTKRNYKPCINRPVIYNAYDECEILANKALHELKAGIPKPQKIS
jgi:hypothetical protein